ncbi:MAG: hypothetical protein ABI221_02135 [Candidatus Saccharimonadales bacterium]
MAGTYPDVPGSRFAYDADGTVAIVYSMSGGLITTLSSAALKNINLHQNLTANIVLDTRNFTYGQPYNYLTFLFPEARTISGYFTSISGSSPAPTGGFVIASSTDTTTGQNGTWTSLINPYVYHDGYMSPLAPAYRSGIQVVNWTNITALRFAMTDVSYGLHLYGSIPTSESPDRLRIVDLSNNDIAAQLDYGDIPQRNIATKQFKVVNNSTTQTANNITITLDTNPDASPTMIGQYQLSTDNTAFANAINIGTLAPGASSGTLYLRNSVSSSAQLGPWALRLVATPNSWS